MDHCIFDNTLDLHLYCKLTPHHSLSYSTHYPPHLVHLSIGCDVKANVSRHKSAYTDTTQSASSDYPLQAQTFMDMWTSVEGLTTLGVQQGISPLKPSLLLLSFNCLQLRKVCIAFYDAEIEETPYTALHLHRTMLASCTVTLHIATCSSARYMHLSAHAYTAPGNIHTPSSHLFAKHRTT